MWIYAPVPNRSPIDLKSKVDIILSTAICMESIFLMWFFFVIPGHRHLCGFSLSQKKPYKWWWRVTLRKFNMDSELTWITLISTRPMKTFRKLLFTKVCFRDCNPNNPDQIQISKLSPKSQSRITVEFRTPFLDVNFEKKNTLMERLKCHMITVLILTFISKLIHIITINSEPVAF